MDTARDKWAEAGAAIEGLGRKLKQHYEGAGPEAASKEEIQDALGRVGDSLTAALDAVGRAIQDPDVQQQAKQAGRSVVDALAAELAKYGIDFRGSGGSQRSEWDVRDELTGGDGLGHSNGGEPRPPS